MKIALFLTRGMSLTRWEKIGTLDREIKPYLELAKTHDITIFTYGKDKPIKGLTILPIWRSLFMKFDYLKTNQMDGALMAVLNKWLHGGKLIVRCGYEWLRFLENTNAPKWKQWIAYLVESIAYNHAEKIVITSYTEAQFILDSFGRETIVIPNYIDLDRFKKLGIRRKKGRALFVGRPSKEKNIDRVRQTADFRGLKLYCIFGGVPQSRLPEEYNKSEYYIQLSTTEGCSKTLLEARACGCKCIYSPIPTNEEIMEQPIENFSFENIMKLEKQLYEG